MTTIFDLPTSGECIVLCASEADKNNFEWTVNKWREFDVNTAKITFIIVNGHPYDALNKPDWQGKGLPVFVTYSVEESWLKQIKEELNYFSKGIDDYGTDNDVGC